jgi:hypothetical protein
MWVWHNWHLTIPATGAGFLSCAPIISSCDGIFLITADIKNQTFLIIMLCIFTISVVIIRSPVNKIKIQKFTQH